MDESHPVHELDADVSLDGLSALYHRHVHEVYGFIFRRCGGDVALAEDITQDTFVRAARHVRAGAAVPTAAWLYDVARSRLIDHWRAQSRGQGKLRLVSGSSSSGVTNDHVDGVVSGQVVLAVLADLPSSQRAALVLRYLDGYSTRDVAEALGRSVKATESLLARARRNLDVAYREQTGA